MLGLIIGLVTGLAIALVVALMIIKSPAPLNKQGKQDKPTISSVSPAADPNQPMYRNKDVPKDIVKEGDAAKPEAQIADNAVKPEAKEAASATKAEEKWTYYLQAGAFKNSIDAESMRARLALLGYEAGVSEMISQNGTLYRVRVGPFKQAEPMNRVRVQMAESGVEASVTRLPK